MKLATTTLLVCVAALLALGMVMLYSADDNSNRLIRQAFGIGLGGAACIICCLLPYRHLKWGSIVFMGFAMLLLILVLHPSLGHLSGGARRWLMLGGIRLQPSELAKLAVIIGLAHYAEHYRRHMTGFWKGLVIPMLCMAPILGLIFVEPDRGGTILLAAVGCTIMVVAGVRWLHLLPMVSIGLAVLAVALWADPVRRARILSWTDVENTKEEVGYQAYQAQLALGSGGFEGRGLGDGLIKRGLLPEDHTDFLFAIIGEELGILATLGILVAFLLILICGVYIACHARDLFGFYLAAGLTMLICLQAFINMGVVTGTLPNKGLPLPFISFGGSNLVVMLTSIGLLLSVAVRAHAVSSAIACKTGNDPLEA